MVWNVIKQEIVFRTPPFKVEELHFKEDERVATHPYYRLRCANWINVLPVTRDGDAILIRQHRAGSLTHVLETPGGVIDPKEINDPTMAALRELEEETGYTSNRMLLLSSCNPNPALQDNRIYYFLALDCHIATERKHFPDPEENIEVVLVKTHELDQLVRLGRIDHALSALCILLASKYVNIKPDSTAI
jgi:ADP-ribose pyrophosphatase